MKRLIVAALALACAACTPTLSQIEAAGTAADAAGAKAPAPLAATAIDEQAIIIGLEAADTVAYQIDALVAAGQLQPGSPAALKVRAALIKLRGFLAAASAAQQVGNATSYAAAIRSAATAMREASAALRGA